MDYLIVSSKSKVQAGQRYGFLVTRGYLGGCRWMCDCDCGNDKAVMSYSLTRATTKSCGCFRTKTTSERVRADIAGVRQGRLVAREYHHTEDNHRWWLCDCDCGSVTVVKVRDFSSGNTKSCGCLKRTTLGDATRTHGLTETAEYRTWRNIKSRCLNPNVDCYKHYGGRGITLWAGWVDDAAAFCAYVGRKPGSNYSIDRYPDNNGHYEPGNVRWATTAEQALNRRNNRMVEVCGVSRTVKEWSAITRVPAKTICARLNANVLPEIALTAPLRKFSREVERNRRPGSAFQKLRSKVWVTACGVCEKCGLDTVDVARRLMRKRLGVWDGTGTLLAFAARWHRLLVRLGGLTLLHRCWMNTVASGEGPGLLKPSFLASLWDVDHKVPRSEGGAFDDMNNVQSLCLWCHGKKSSGLRG